MKVLLSHPWIKGSCLGSRQSQGQEGPDLSLAFLSRVLIFKEVLFGVQLWLP